MHLPTTTLTIHTSSSIFVQDTIRTVSILVYGPYSEKIVLWQCIQLINQSLEITIQYVFQLCVFHIKILKQNQNQPIFRITTLIHTSSESVPLNSTSHSYSHNTAIIFLTVKPNDMGSVPMTYVRDICGTALSDKYSTEIAQILEKRCQQLQRCKLIKIYATHRQQYSNLKDCPDAKQTSSRNSSLLHLICFQSLQLSAEDKKVAIFRK